VYKVTKTTDFFVTFFPSDVILNFRGSPSNWDIAQGKEELRVVIIEVLIGDPGSVDASVDLDVGTDTGC